MAIFNSYVKLPEGKFDSQRVSHNVMDFKRHTLWVPMPLMVPDATPAGILPASERPRLHSPRQNHV